MKRMVVCLVLGVGLSSAWAQQVWKCEEGGQVRYSDQPCKSTGKTLSDRSLQPNMVDGMKPEAVRAAVAAPSAPVSTPQAPAGNSCPGDAEIRDMETRGNSTTLGDAERQFMQDEVRRAWQCRKGAGRYTDGDWAISRQAQAAQSNNTWRDRHDARVRAESMHSAADPEEGRRIERRHFAEERIRQAQKRAQNPASAPIP